MNELLRVSQPYIDTYLDISKADIILEKNSLDYDGTVKEPKILSITYKGKILIEGKDYVIGGETSGTNLGEHFLKIYGILDYGGVLVKKWYIKNKGSILVAKKITLGQIGVEKTYTVSKVGDGNLIINNINNEIAISTYDKDTSTIKIIAVENGETSISITLEESEKYTGDEIEIVIKVNTNFSPILADNDPALISIAAQEGTASTLWEIGDKTAQIHIDTFGSVGALDICAFIIGFDHNSENEGIGITFQIGKSTNNEDIAICDTNYSTSTKINGYSLSFGNSLSWENSAIRQDICSLFFSALPLGWQEIIIPTKKTWYYVQSSGFFRYNVYTTSGYDKIFLLSCKEIGLAASVSSDDVEYQYYINGNSIIKYNHLTNRSCVWYLRELGSSGSSYYWSAVSTRGAKYASRSSGISYGFAPAFRVG